MDKVKQRITELNLLVRDAHDAGDRKEMKLLCYMQHKLNTVGTEPTREQAIEAFGWSPEQFPAK